MKTPLRPFVFCDCHDHAFVTSTKGFVILVSMEDVEALCGFNWCTLISGNRPIALRHDRSKTPKNVYISRQIMAPDQGMVVDHINGNTMDNRRENLRVCTVAENVRNKRKFRGTSKFKGVCWDKSRGKWLAIIGLNGKQKNLGRFKQEFDAAKAYDNAAEVMHGKFAATNKTLGLFNDE